MSSPYNRLCAIIGGSYFRDTYPVRDLSLVVEPDSFYLTIESEPRLQVT